jgi:hypothetical protein
MVEPGLAHTRMEESQPALDTWGRDRRCEDMPLHDWLQGTFLSVAIIGPCHQHPRDSIGRTGGTERLPLISGVLEDDETAMRLSLAPPWVPK